MINQALPATDEEIARFKLSKSPYIASLITRLEAEKALREHLENGCSLFMGPDWRQTLDAVVAASLADLPWETVWGHYEEEIVRLRGQLEDEKTTLAEAQKYHEAYRQEMLATMAENVQHWKDKFEAEKTRADAAEDRVAELEQITADIADGGEHS